MIPDAERFIDLATRPLDDNAELRLAARARLREAIEENKGESPEALAEAVNALERADRHPLRRRWRMVLVGIMLAVSLPYLTGTFFQFRQLARSRILFGHSATYGPRDFEMAGLGLQQRLLLSGASDATSDSEKWKPLWESEPENAAFLAEYASAYFRDHKKLSEEITSAAGRLDPENGWFPALAAAGIAEGAVTKERVPYSYGTKSPSKTAVWIINDEERLNEALAAIHQFAGKPKFTAYQNEMLRRRIPLLPPRRDFVSQLPALLYVTMQPAPGIGLRRLSDVMSAGAQQCAAHGDVAGLERIVADWEALVPQMVKGGDSMIDVLIAKAIYHFPVANFRDAAKTLGMEDEAERFGEIYDRHQAERNVRTTRRPASDSEVLVAQRGSVMTSLTLPMLDRQVTNPPVLTDDDLRPGRYADQAMLERAGAWVAWFLLGLCAISAVLVGKLRNPLARSLSGRIQRLIRPSDWAWMIAGGIAFPLVWYFMITRVTPLSAREWSSRMTMFIQPGGQLGCMAASMVILTVQVASWRLAKRGAVIGLVARYPWMGWMAAAAALLGIPAFGGLMLPGLGGAFQITAFVLSGVAGVWLVAAFSLAIFGRASQALHRATLARLVWPVRVFGMLVMACLVPYFHSEERRWIQQDRISEITTDAPASTRYEYEVTQILKGELLEILGDGSAETR